MWFPLTTLPRNRMVFLLDAIVVVDDLRETEAFCVGDRPTKIILLIALAAVFRSQYPSSTTFAPPLVPQSFRTTSVIQSTVDRRATLRLTPGTSVLLGSLDQSAHRHPVRLVWRPDHQSNAVGAVETQLLTGSHSVMMFPEVWDAPVEAVLPEADREPFVSVIPEMLSDGLLEPHEFESPRRRRFVVPCFYAQRVHDRHVLATEIARGQRVSVFLVDGDEPAFGEPDETLARDAAFAVASEIIRRTEDRVLNFVESRIGYITDLDEDGRLCFVLARLSTEDSADSTQQPITGCVRPDDFLSGLRSENTAHTGGDIVYLDCQLPTGRELDALLAHELSHAATFCVIGQSEPEDQQQLPGWLNEAIAHYLEMQVHCASDNLQTRMADFTREPHRFPLVIPDSLRQRSLRRGATRAAACLFLESALQKKPAESLRTLVRCPQPGTGRLESVTGERFSETFRKWGLSLMVSARDFPQQVLAQDCELQLELAGTAFTWTAPVHESGTLEIVANEESQLQVTIVTVNGSRTAAVDAAQRQ